MEDIVLKRMRKIVGWDEGDGIFSPGKSRNFMGFLSPKLWNDTDIQIMLRFAKKKKQLQNTF